MRASCRSLRPSAVAMLALLAELFVAAHGARILTQASIRGCSPVIRATERSTCADIATVNGLSVDDIASLNPGIRCGYLISGQPVCLGANGDNSGDTSPTGCSPTYRVRAGDTCQSLADAAGLDTWRFNLLNPALPCSEGLVEGQVVCLGPTGPVHPPADPGTLLCQRAHLLRANDTCEGLAMTHFLGLGSLRAINPYLDCEAGLEAGDYVCLERQGCLCEAGGWAQACCPPGLPPPPAYPPPPYYTPSFSPPPPYGIYTPPPPAYPSSYPPPASPPIPAPVDMNHVWASPLLFADGLPEAEDIHTTNVVCDSFFPMTLQCETGNQIGSIVSAFYGRSDTTTCPTTDSNAMASTTCSSPDFQTKVSDLCVGQTSCPVQSTIVPDPCYGIFKWGTVSYTCVPIPGTVTKTVGPVCDGNMPMTMQCEAGMRIAQVSTTFGRDDTTTCPYAPDPNAQSNTQCTSSEWPSMVQGKCRGLQTCAVSGTEVPDPCVGTYKYAKAIYTCEELTTSACFGTMSCVKDAFDPNSLADDPGTLSGAPALMTAVGSVFSFFATNQLVTTAAGLAQVASGCPLVVLSGADFAQMATYAKAGTTIKNLYTPDLKSAANACAFAGKLLAPTEDFIVGAIAFDMTNPTANAPAGKSGAQTSFLGNSVAICAAINPCDNVYVFGFDGVSVTLPVSATPPLSITVSLTSVGYSDDPANMQLPLNQIWTYPGGNTPGTFTNMKFQSNIIVGGSASMNLGLKTPSGTDIATLIVVGNLRLGINLDPLGDGKDAPNNDDFGFAINIVGAPKLDIANFLVIDLSGMVSAELDIVWMYKRSDDWMLAVSLTEQFDLAGLFASVPAVKSVLENLFNIKGQISIDLYVDQNNVALFLDCKGEIDILPVLDIPPIKGELGVLLSIGFGETGTFDVGFVINGELYCLSSYGRDADGVAKNCPAGYASDGVQCYPACRQGYSLVTGICYQDCPAGYRDDGAFCAKPDNAYWRDAWWDEDDCNANTPQGCEEWGWFYYPRCNPGTFAFGCCVCTPVCPDGMTDIGVSCAVDSYISGDGTPFQCNANEDQEAFVCYPKCKEGYTGVGPVCWRVC